MSPDDRPELVAERRRLDERPSAAPGPGHRRRRDHRVDHRRPAARRGRRPRRSPRQPGPRPRGRTSRLRSSDPRTELVEGDLRDRDLVHDLTRGSDVVFHQAAIRITQCAEEPRLALEVLVDGTFNVLEAAAEHRVDKVIAASSASVYGMAEQFPTDERHHHHNNDTFYGAAKSFNEGMLRSFRAMYGLDYVALRYFNVYGPRMDVHGLYTEVLVRWMERIADGQPPLIFGDGSQTMDFVYTEDIARANILAAEQRRHRGRLQHRQRAWRPACSSSPRRCCGRWTPTCRRARPGARRQRRRPAARRHLAPRSATSASPTTGRSRTACASSSSGGRRSARRSPPVARR